MTVRPATHAHGRSRSSGQPRSSGSDWNHTRAGRNQIFDDFKVVAIIDWELVALQRHLWNRSDEEMRAALRQRFFDELCSADNDVAFYVGNQAKRLQTFSILGVYYPKEGS